jgi:hypothetical protein
MSKESDSTTSDAGREQQRASAHRVRLPGFVIDEDVGLGDAVKRVTYAMGVTPCSGCERRAAALNRWVTLAGKSSRRT